MDSNYDTTEQNITTSYVVGMGDEVIIVGSLVIPILMYLLYQVLCQIIPPNDNSQIPNAEDLSSGQLRAQPHDCSICLEETKLAVQTNCGHVYCGQCIMHYYDSAMQGKLSLFHVWNENILILTFSFLGIGPLEVPTCPYCRQRITVLLLYFSEAERKSTDLELIEQRNQLITSIKAYNRRFSGNYLDIELIT